MHISASGTTPALQLRLPQKAIEGLVLKGGATLVATVQRSEPSGELTLEISGKLLQAFSNLRLAAGITLQLRVEKTTDGIVLHLDESESQRLMYQQALRQNLPRQQSLQPLLQKLAQWYMPDTNAVAKASSIKSPVQNSDTTQTIDIPTASLPKPVAQTIARIFEVLPTLKQLVRPQGLQQAIAVSGLFLEHHLLHAARPTELDRDIKTVLLRLAQSIRQHLTDSKTVATTATRETLQETLHGLLRQIEAGIARIQLNQLNALGNRNESEQRLSINLELPIFDPQRHDINMLQIRIQRNDGGRKSKAATGWSVVLHLTSEDYGDIHTVVTLSEGKVSTTFWCEEETTAKLFREQLHLLEQRFAEQGLETAQCSSRCGKPPQELAAMADNNPKGLIDTQA